MESFEPQQTDTDNPYRAPSSEVSGGPLEQVDSQQALASRGQRLGAYFLDGLVVGVPILAMIFLGIGFASSAGADGLIGVIAVLAIVLAGAAGIVNLIMLGTRGQTIGKYLMDIKIVRAGTHQPASGVRIILGREAFRFIGGSIPWLGSFFFLADSLAIFQSSQQCLHDMVADTNVIKVDGAETRDQWDREWERNQREQTAADPTAAEREPAPTSDPMKSDSSPSSGSDGEEAEIDLDLDQSGDDVHW